MDHLCSPPRPRDAVRVVIGLSLYANFIGEFSAYQAARAEEAGEGS